MEPTSFAATAGAWAWSKYGKDLTDRASVSIKRKWARFKWRAASEEYRAKIMKLYGTMQIMGMAAPVPLDDIFTDAYILDKPTAFGRFDIESLKQMSTEPGVLPPQTKRINGLRLVVEKGNLFILGKPGAGKTTFLKYIAIKAGEQVIDKVPIFISLKHWADSGLTLLPFMAERFDVCNFPAAQAFLEELLESGNAIVLFDGLDEVNQESGQRDTQTHAINDFVEKYDLTQCLMTCRIAANDYSFQHFTYVEIADFTESQIQKFVFNWFRDDQDTRDRFISDFRKEINKGLRDLARTPLLLTLLCLAFEETLTFPQRRVEIYEEAVDALLKKWDSSRRIKRDEVYRKLSLGHKENMLAQIAAETFERNEYFLPQAELEKRIADYAKNVPPHDTDEATDGEAILKAIEAQHGVFVERARGVYSFSHLTFQEYFTAKYLVANAARGTLRRLIKNHCADERWREVYLLTSSLLQDGSQFIIAFRRGIDELLKGDKDLIAALAWAERKAAASQTNSWQMRLMYLSFVVPVLQNFEAASSLDNVRNPHLSLDATFALASRTLNGDLKERNRKFRETQKLAQRLRLNELSEELAAVSLPISKAPAVQQRQFEAKVLSLMTKYRDIKHEWSLSDPQRWKLSSYLSATGLLQDCLKLAFMPPDKKAVIQESLYLPPNHPMAMTSARLKS